MGVGDSRLDWDHNTAHPTFSRDIRHEGASGVCHYFIQGGRQEFLADSSHILAGRTVDLPCYPMTRD